MTTPPRPPDADDDRDPRLAALLEVPPLDEVTRARLVRTALAGAEEEAPGPPGARRPLARILAVAAAVLAVLVVGLAVLVPRGSDDSRPTALDVPSRSSDATESSEPSGSAKRASPEASAAPTSGAPRAPTPSADASALEVTVPSTLTLPSIGDLGDVSNEARLARVAAPRLALPRGAATVTIDGCAVSAGQAFGTPVAAGTGTIDGRPAVVVVAEQASGTTAVVAVRGRSCGRGVSAILP